MRNKWVKLFHNWGLANFTDNGFTYELWDDCCVFATKPCKDFEGAEVHMAMHPKKRHKCRDAVKYMQGKQSKIIAYIEDDLKPIQNLLNKCGFNSIGEYKALMINGETKMIKVMVWAE